MKHLKRIKLLTVSCLALTGTVFASNPRSSDWKTWRYENYGFEFKLPSEWQPIESDLPQQDNVHTIVFAPQGAEFFTRAYNTYLRLLITDNPNKLSYEKLLGLEERDDLLQDYQSKKADRTIGGKPGKLIYDSPELKYGPIAIVTLDKNFISILSPKEGPLFTDTSSFETLLTTFKFFPSIPSSTNFPTPVKVQKTNDAQGCAKAPVPGNCIAELARTEPLPDSSWCESITRKNSHDNEGFYYFYKNSCYKYAAPKLKDIRLCDKMEGEGSSAANKAGDQRDCRSWVNYELALQEKDVSYCDKMDIESYIFDGYGMSPVSYLDCYVAVAAKTGNSHLCDRIIPRQRQTGGITTKAWCLYNYAVRNKDCSLVPPDSPATRSQCESQIKNFP